IRSVVCADADHSSALRSEKNDLHRAGKAESRSRQSRAARSDYRRLSGLHIAQTSAMLPVPGQRVGELVVTGKDSIRTIFVTVKRHESSGRAESFPISLCSALNGDRPRGDPSLDISRFAWQTVAQELRAGLGHEHVVFDAHAEFLLGQVDARFEGDPHSEGKRPQ